MPPVSFLQYELPSGKTPSPCEIHRKTVALSIDRIDTNRQFLDQLPLCKGFAEPSPASLTWSPPHSYQPYVDGKRIQAPSASHLPEFHKTISIAEVAPAY